MCREMPDMDSQEPITIRRGLRVLVTAGAAGIGRAIADTFADHGAQVHVCDLSADALDACLKQRPDYVTTLCDVAEQCQVARLFDEVRANWDGLDVLINNAGIAGPTGGVGTIDPDDWRRTVDVNLNGQFYCAHYGVDLLRRSDDPAIVCISSVAGRLGFPLRTPYAATKWAIIGLMKSLAGELGPEGIRVNAVLPGIVEGPRIERVIADRARALGKTYDQMAQENLEKVSLRRMVTAQDVANTVLFLCSPLGRNISGQPISVCGNAEAL